MAKAATPLRTKISNAKLIAAAARKWHVPFWILAGVKVAETGTGSGIGEVSSTGAKGPFQFEPETAASYHVDVNSFQSSAEGAAHYLHDLFAQHHSWDAALQAYSGGGYGEAHVREKAAEGGVKAPGPNEHFTKPIIAELFKLGYDAKKMAELEVNIKGHGRTLRDFEAAIGGRKGSANLTKVIKEYEESTGLEGAVHGAEEAVKNPLEALGTFFSALTNLQTWIRILEVLAAAVLAYMGIKNLTGADPIGKAAGIKLPPLKAGLGPAAA